MKETETMSLSQYPKANVEWAQLQRIPNTMLGIYTDTYKSLQFCCHPQ